MLVFIKVIEKSLIFFELFFEVKFIFVWVLGFLVN